MFPLIVPDQPGFVVNRLLFAMMNEAISIVDSDKISAEDIDKAAIGCTSSNGTIASGRLHRL